MENRSERPGSEAGRPKRVAIGSFRGLMTGIQKRIVSGLVLALPIGITFGILYYLYTTLKVYVLDRMAGLVKQVAGYKFGELPPWWDRFASPLVSVLLVLLILYILGYFVRSRIYQVFEWVLMRVPGVTVIYKAVRNVFRSLEGGSPTFRRVVLVPFPHPGSRALAFVTKTLVDTRTQKPILCVCVLTGVVPPAGFTLFVPEEEVTDVDWSVNQTLQAILSGGINSPATIPYFGGPAPAGGAGPLVDVEGRPIEACPEP